MKSIPNTFNSDSLIVYWSKYKPAAGRGDITCLLNKICSFCAIEKTEKRDRLDDKQIVDLIDKATLIEIIRNKKRKFWKFQYETMEFLHIF